MVVLRTLGDLTWNDPTTYICGGALAPKCPSGSATEHSYSVVTNNEPFMDIEIASNVDKNVSVIITKINVHIN